MHSQYEFAINELRKSNPNLVLDYEINNNQDDLFFGNYNGIAKNKITGDTQNIHDVDASKLYEFFKTFCDKTTDTHKIINVNNQVIDRAWLL